MKGTLEFNLPEDQNEFETCQNGFKYLGAIQDFDNELRQIIKYGGEGVSKDTLEAYAEIRKKLHDTCSDADFSVWD